MGVSMSEVCHFCEDESLERSTLSRGACYLSPTHGLVRRTAITMYKVLLVLMNPRGAQRYKVRVWVMSFSCLMQHWSISVFKQWLTDD